MEKKKRKILPTIGWREWVTLPDLGIESIKAKVDTGARSSALHAFGLELFERDGTRWARFEVHPRQNVHQGLVEIVAEIVAERSVRSSNGRRELRPVICTDIELMDQRWPIDITLTNRDEMGFRMLLGRQAVRRKFLVHAGRSFLGSETRALKP
ncbi:MAG: hypothetical protein ACI906_005011 [Candidatus Latescibacterota bacterium]